MRKAGGGDAGLSLCLLSDEGTSSSGSADSMYIPPAFGISRPASPERPSGFTVQAGTVGSAGSGAAPSQFLPSPAPQTETSPRNSAQRGSSIDLRASSFKFQQPLERSGSEAREAALLPYPAIVQRKKLADELYSTLRRCAAAYERGLSDEQGSDAQRGVGLSVAACRHAIAELCCSVSERKGIQPCVNWLIPSRRARQGAVASVVLLAGAVSYFVAQLLIRPDDEKNDADLHARTNRTLLAFLFWLLFMFLGPFILANVSAVTGEQLHHVVPCMRRYFTAPTPPGAGKVSIYCENPHRLTFVATPMGSLMRDEQAADFDGGLVSLPMFLGRCLSLCIPIATAGEQKAFESQDEGYPFASPGWTGFVGRVRHLFEVLQVRESHDTNPAETTVPTATFARSIARCDVEYTSVDVQCIAAYCGVPDEMALIDALVLAGCLAFDPKKPIAEGVASRSPAHLISLGAWQSTLDNHRVQTMIKLCEQAFASAPREPQQSNAQIVTDVAFGNKIKQWLQPRDSELIRGEKPANWDQHTADHEAKVEKWEHVNRTAVGDYLKAFNDAENVGLEHLVDVVLQLWCHGDVAKVHAARAHFEAVAGNLSAPADPNELLDLMYGPGVLLEDERKRALEMLGAAQLGAKMELERAMRDVELHTRTTGCFDLASEALDKISRIKAQQGGQVETRVTRYSLWVAFAIQSGIPTAQEDAVVEPFASKEKPHKLRHNHARKKQQSVVNVKSYWTTFGWIISGASIGRRLWKIEYKNAKGSPRSVLRAAVFALLFGAMFATPMVFPWYWAIFSTYDGIVPAYVTCAPLVLILIAAHFLANTSIAASNAHVGVSRLHLSCATTWTGEPTAIDGRMLLDTTGGGKPKDFVDHKVIAVTVLTTLAVYIGYIFMIDMPGENSKPPTSIVEAEPSYWKEFLGGRCFFLVIQFVSVEFAVVFGAEFYRGTEASLGAVDDLVRGSPPALDLRRAENLVLWCRLRDHVLRSANGTRRFPMIAAAASISVCWALVAGLASALMVYLGSTATTPFRAVCGWYALVGGLIAMIQVLAILFADGVVARTQRTLEDQSEIVHREALMSQRNGDPEDVARANVLRTAADAINTELNIYRLTPERRFFYLFGVRVKTVLRSVASVVVAQGLAYAWSWMKEQVNDDRAGSGSSWASEHCTWYF